MTPGETSWVQGKSVKRRQALDRVMSRRTTVILDIIMVICPPIDQGRPLGHRAHPQRNRIADVVRLRADPQRNRIEVSLDRVILVRTSESLDRF